MANTITFTGEGAGTETQPLPTEDELTGWADKLLNALSEIKIKFNNVVNGTVAHSVNGVSIDVGGSKDLITKLGEIDTSINTTIPATYETKTNVALKVSKSGNETIAGIKTFESPPVVVAPVDDYDAVPKGYVDSLLTGKLGLTGGTMTGHIILPTDNYDEIDANILAKHIVSYGYLWEVLGSFGIDINNDTLAEATTMEVDNENTNAVTIILGHSTTNPTAIGQYRYAFVWSNQGVTPPSSYGADNIINGDVFTIAKTNITANYTDTTTYLWIQFTLENYGGISETQETCIPVTKYALSATDIATAIALNTDILDELYARLANDTSFKSAIASRMQSGV